MAVIPKDDCKHNLYLKLLSREKDESSDEMVDTQSAKVKNLKA